MTTETNYKKPIRINNTDARNYVQRRIPFDGSNLFARWRNTDTDTPHYVVYSYGLHFPMYCYANGTWWANEGKYSRTTTRHQNQTRPLHQGDQLQWLDTDAMQILVYGGYTALAKARIVA